MEERRIKPGEVLFDRYEIERLLGEGGMGQVWAAKDLTLRRPVAIKIIRRKYADHAAYVARFERETQAVAQLNHPNIVQIYHADRTADGLLYMVMERIPGVPLRLIIETARRVDLLSAVFIAIQIAEALGAAHRVGIWHRDIKPENIMVSDEGRAWVLDFGIARQRRGAEERAVLRRGARQGTGRLGTAGYMPPEEVLNQTADQRGDFYQLGVVLYEMLAGRKPYMDVDERNESEMLSAHAFSEARPLVEVVPDCPEWIWPIVARLLEKDPDARYDDVDVLIADLRAGLRESAPPGPKNHPWARKIDQDRHEQARKKAFAKRGPLTSVPPEGATSELTPSSPDQRISGGTEPMLGGWSSTGPVGNKPQVQATAPLPADFVPSSPYSARRINPALGALTATAPLPPGVLPAPSPFSAAPYVLSPPAVPPPSASLPYIALAAPISPAATAAPAASIAVGASIAATIVAPSAAPIAAPIASVEAPVLVPARSTTEGALSGPPSPLTSAPRRQQDGAAQARATPGRPAVAARPRGGARRSGALLSARLLFGAAGIGIAAVVAMVLRSRWTPPAVAREDIRPVASASASTPAAPVSAEPIAIATVAATSAPVESPLPVQSAAPLESAEMAVSVAPALSVMAAPAKSARSIAGPAQSPSAVPMVTVTGKSVPADKAPSSGDKPARRGRGQELF